jgi:hypothetical protein
MTAPTSTRNLPLLLSSPATTIPIITVENYIKWYDLYVVHPNGTVHTIAEVPAYANAAKQIEQAFVARTGKSAQGDHIWHPGYVQMLATNLGFLVDEIALETLIGRWFMEHLNQEPENL